ncbi:MAG: heme A synthase [Gammaproteobacteria bacterium]|jgi:heme A synthase
MQTDKLFLNLTIITIILALIVIVLGANIRLSHAGPGVNYEYSVLEIDVQTVIHDSHRIGAIEIWSMRDVDSKIRTSALAITVLLLIHFSLVTANIFFIIPISVAHNGVATLLLASMGTLLFFTRYPDK